MWSREGEMDKSRERLKEGVAERPKEKDPVNLCVYSFTEYLLSTGTMHMLYSKLETSSVQNLHSGRRNQSKKPNK